MSRIAVWLLGRGGVVLRDGRLQPTALAQTKSDAPAIYTDKGADREQRLIAAAKKEGSVTFYTSMQTQESGPLAKAFEAKYGIKVQLWRATSDQVIQRTVNEARANRQGLDVLETNAPEVDSSRARTSSPNSIAAHSGRPAGLGDPAAPALVRGARQSLGGRVQHRQGEEGGDPGDL